MKAVISNESEFLKFGNSDSIEKIKEELLERLEYCDEYDQILIPCGEGYSKDRVFEFEVTAIDPDKIVFNFLGTWKG